MNSNTTTPNFDNLLLQSLMAKLQIRPSTSPFLSPKSLEDLLFNNNLSSSDDDEEYSRNEWSWKTQLAKEESRLEKHIIGTILSGKIDSLKPNSGEAVVIDEHHICIGFHQDPSSDYRVWEWHGHVMLFDHQNGYTPEYIYGNYFQTLTVNLQEDDKVANLGLKELIESTESNNQPRILRRNMNAASPRV